MIKVLAISRAWGEHAGGMERLSYELLHALAQAPELELTTIVNRTAPSQSLTQARWRSLWFALTALPRALAAARRADVIHLGDPVLSLAGWLIKQLYRKPVAVTVHGLDITFDNSLYQLYLRLFFRRFDAYLPISTHAAQALQRHKIRGRVQVIHPGVHDRFYDPSLARQSLSRLIKWPLANERVLLTVGRLVPRKGHAWFIQNVLPQLPATTLYVIAGDGPARATIPPSQRVIQLGRISDRDLKILYNTADAFIQPNVATPGETEGFGLVMLEAALCERPVFASNIEGISDAIKSGHNGTLLPAGDAQAWQTILNDFLKNPQTNPAARTYTLEHFAWPKQAQAFRHIFERLAPSARS